MVKEGEGMLIEEHELKKNRKVKKIETVEVNLDTAREMIQFQKDKLEKLQIELDNVSAQQHQSKIQFEHSQDLDKEALRAKMLEENKKLSIREAGINSKYDVLELKEEEFKKRMLELENREIQVVDVDKKYLELNQERSNFNKYKYDVELELEQARAVILESKGIDDKQEAFKGELEAREKLIAQRELYCDRTIGELQEKEKKLTIREQNINGLNQVKEKK